MRFSVRAAGTVLALAFLVLSGTEMLNAQGVTSAAVRGRVLDDAGSPVEGAIITLVNKSTGEKFIGRSRAGGLYNIENVAVGGPYTVEARLIGYRPVSRSGINLSLGQALSLDLSMTRAAVTLEAIVVESEQQDVLTSAGRTGTAGLVSDSAVSRLPTLNRNFTDFVVTVPQVAELNPGAGLSLGGGHRKQNSIQIDGVSDNDLFGLGSTGQPGGQVGAKSITLEAVKEFQVLIAPFDVRQSGFAGGLINAVTKRGTNQYHGSAFWYYQDDALVRDSLPANDAVFGDFRQHQRGFSLGGPLVRDKVHFFVAGEWQVRNVPNGGVTIGKDALDQVRIQPDSAQRVVDIFRNVYGVDPGSYTGVTLHTPNRNVFARLDFQLGDNHNLTVRYNHVNASGDGLSRSTGFYGFSSFNRTIRSNTNGIVTQLNSTLGQGKYYNELRIGFNRIRDRRAPDNIGPGGNAIRPQIEINSSSSNIPGQSSDVFNRFVVGGERFSQRNELDQDIVELDDALTFATRNHTLTFGTHNEYISFRNLFFHTADGQWRFNSLADLEAGNPSRYFAQIPFPGKGPPVADWSIFQAGAYAQDQIDFSEKFKLTVGLRIDVPFILDDPDQNTNVAASFGRNTSEMPSGNIHWSPRLGFNWDPMGTRTTVVRGGLGIFTGRPPYVWVSNAFTNTGQEVQEVSCRGSDIPTFDASVFQNAPQACAGGGGASAPQAQVNIFQSDFRFPQLFKANVAFDQKLPSGILGTFEVLYTRGVNTILLKEINLQPSSRVNAEGRMMFGTIDSTSGDATPARIDPNFVQVLDHGNASEDWSLQLTTQLQKRFGQGFEFNAGYTYSKVRDLTSQTSSIATSNFGFRPVSQGRNPNDPPLSTSWFEVPHRVVISGTFNVPIPSLPSAVTFIYSGQSGQPYTWTVDGDANGDGYEAPNISRRNNDIIYVPRDASDFTGDGASDFDDFNALINAEPCLRNARGSIPKRNSCRNPWRTRLDANIRVSVGRFIGGRRHNLTLVADVFNLLNLLNSDWGVVKTVSFNETRNALQLRGYDAANDRGIYRYRGPSIEDGKPQRSINDLASRWRAQIGLRYDF